MTGGSVLQATSTLDTYSDATNNIGAILEYIGWISYQCHDDRRPHRLSLQDLREWLAEILPLRCSRQAPSQLPSYGRVSLRRRTGPAHRCYYVKRKRRKNG